MNDTYLKNQNISNNIILNKANIISRKKSPLLNKDKNDSYSSSDEDKNETIDNKINDSSFFLGMEELPLPKDNLRNINKSKQINKQISVFKIQKNDNYSRNKNSTKDFPKNNYLTEDRRLTRPISGKIITLPNTENMEDNDENNNEILFINTRATSKDKILSKQTESRFTSSSENKYHIFQRKTVSNGKFNVPYIIGGIKNIPLNNRKNNQFQTTKVIKLSDKNDENNKTMTKNSIKKITDNYKGNNYNTTNNANGLSNINIQLSPQRHISMAEVGKIKNANLEIIENKTMNNVNKRTNTHLRKGKHQDNLGLIQNNVKSLKDSRNNSSKNFEINKTTNNRAEFNFNLPEANNSMNSFSMKKLISSNKVNPVNDNNDSPEKSPRDNKKSDDNRHSIDDDMEENKRMTVPYNFLSDNQKNKKCKLRNN